MRHTPESIKRRIMSDELEVVHALRAIARINGFGCGGRNFGMSLVEWCETKRLTEKQLFAARNMIVGNYLAVLANAANAKEEENNRAEAVYEQEEKDYRDGWAAQERANERFVQEFSAEPNF